MTETTFVRDESKKSLTMTREFAGSINQVFKAFTDHRVLDKWWAPKPYICKTKSHDFKEGGSWLFSMSGTEAGSQEVYAGFDFKTIVSGKGFSGQDYFCDSKGENRHTFSLWKYDFTPSSIGTKVQVEINFETLEELNKSDEMKDAFISTHKTLDEILRIWNKPTFVKDEAKKRLVITREFNGTAEQLWYAWTHAKILDQWWAPKPWRTVTKTQDFREGGIWHFAMKGPGSGLAQCGKTELAHWCKTEYSKIIPFKLWEGQDCFCDEKGESKMMGNVCKIEIVPVSAEITRVEMEKTYKTLEDLERDLEMGFKEGSAMAYSNLDTFLKKPKAFFVKTNTVIIVDEEQKQMTVSRAFAAPLDQVWPAWTDHKIIDRWWAPLPFTNITKHYDFTENGYWFYAMVHKQESFYARSNYKKIIEKKLIEGDDFFCDEKGENPNTLTYRKTFFSEIGKNETKVEVEYNFKTSEDLKKMTEDMNCYDGWATALQQLDEILLKGENPSSSTPKRGGKRKEMEGVKSNGEGNKKAKAGD